MTFGKLKPNQYIGLVAIKKLSSFMSMAGSLTIIGISRHKLDEVYHRIVFILSVSDILSSASIFVSPWVMPNKGELAHPYALGNETTCAIQGFILIMGLAGTSIMSGFLSLYFLSVVKYRLQTNKVIRYVERPAYIAMAVIWIPILTASIIPPQVSYNPDEFISVCHITEYPSGCAFDDTVDCRRGDIRVGYLGLLAFIMLLIMSMCSICATLTVYRTVRQVLHQSERHSFYHHMNTYNASSNTGMSVLTKEKMEELANKHWSSAAEQESKIGKEEELQVPATNVNNDNTTQLVMVQSNVESIQLQQQLSDSNETSAQEPSLAASETASDQVQNRSGMESSTTTTHSDALPKEIMRSVNSSSTLLPEEKHITQPEPEVKDIRDDCHQKYDEPSHSPMSMLEDAVLKDSFFDMKQYSEEVIFVFESNEGEGNSAGDGSGSEDDSTYSCMPSDCNSLASMISDDAVASKQEDDDISEHIDDESIEFALRPSCKEATLTDHGSRNKTENNDEKLNTEGATTKEHSNIPKSHQQQSPSSPDRVSVKFGTESRQPPANNGPKKEEIVDTATSHDVENPQQEMGGLEPQKRRPSHLRFSLNEPVPRKEYSSFSFNRGRRDSASSTTNSHVQPGSGMLSKDQGLSKFLARTGSCRRSAHARTKNKKLNAVMWQCVLYAVTYINTIFWLTLTLVLPLAYGSKNLDEEIDLPGWYALQVFGWIFFPLQGSLNFIVYIRLKMDQWKRLQPNKGTITLIWRAALYGESKI